MVDEQPVNTTEPNNNAANSFCVCIITLKLMKDEAILNNLTSNYKNFLKIDRT